MANIHILPTDKPSRLTIYSTLLNEFRLLPEPIGDWKNKRNIYITSDETPKEGGYVLWENKVYKYREFMKMRTPVYTDYFSIIITTDLELIKDGVQALEDKEIEFIISNPKVNKLDVTKELCYKPYNEETEVPKEKYEYYMVVLPKEELLKTAMFNIMDNLSIPKEFQANEIEETDQEAAERYTKDGTTYLNEKVYVERGFIAGSQNKAKKMYTEDDLKSAIDFGANLGLEGSIGNSFEWGKVKNNYIKQIKDERSK